MGAIGLIFHGIGTPGRALEDGEAPYWLPVPRFEQILDRIAALPDPQRLRITFDDGNASDLEIAAPRLRQRGLKAHFFALTGRLGKPGSLSADDLHTLVGMGMGVGSHGIGHRNLRRLAPQDLANELRQSRAELERILAQPVTEFAIPFGAYNGPVLAAIRAAGYRAAWSSDRGGMSDTAFLRPRTSFRADTDDAAVSRILSGQMSPVEALQRRLGMLRRRVSRR